MKRVVAVAVVFGLGVTLGSLRSSSPVLAPAVAQDRGTDEEEQGTITKEEQGKREGIFGQAIGGGLALTCYTSHQHMGDLAERVVQGKAKPNEITPFAKALTGMLNHFQGQLKAAVGILTPTDVKAMKPLTNLVGEALALAKLLHKYSEEPTPANGQAFTKKQAATWKNMCKQIGIPAAAGVALSPKGTKLGATK